jgi:hypothetical protein
VLSTQALFGDLECPLQIFLRFTSAPLLIEEIGERIVCVDEVGVIGSKRRFLYANGALQEIFRLVVLTLNLTKFRKRLKSSGQRPLILHSGFS